MENGNFNAKEIIQETQKEVKKVVVKYAKSDKECLAVASALLGFVVPLYKEALGKEQAAMMMYNIADELAIESPLKIDIKKIYINNKDEDKLITARNLKKSRKFRKKK